MQALVLKPIRIKSTGVEHLPGAVIEETGEKILKWAEQELVMPYVPDMMEPWLGVPTLVYDPKLCQDSNSREREGTR